MGRNKCTAHGLCFQGTRIFWPSPQTTSCARAARPAHPPHHPFPVRSSSSARWAWHTKSTEGTRLQARVTNLRWHYDSLAALLATVTQLEMVLQQSVQTQRARKENKLFCKRHTSSLITIHRPPHKQHGRLQPAARSRLQLKAAQGYELHYGHIAPMHGISCHCRGPAHILHRKGTGKSQAVRHSARDGET